MFYQDWTFWSFVVAGLALLLSQLPPVDSWFRVGRLQVEIYSLIHITHKVGNPNSQLHLILSNAGGRAVRITGLSLEFQKGDDQPFLLPAVNYFQNPTDKNGALLAPFLLRPKDEWSHLVNFYKYFDRQEDRWYRNQESILRNEVSRLLREADNQGQLVEVGPQFYQPFVEFFERKFRWEPGEYSVTLRVYTKNAQSDVTRTLRFTIFESDTAELRRYAEDYKYGSGTYWNLDTNVGLVLPLISN